MAMILQAVLMTSCLFLSFAWCKQIWKGRVHYVCILCEKVTLLLYIFTHHFVTGILLCTLVDEMNSIGEIGYYLASFEAVITHLHEIDLAAYMEENLLHTTASFSVVSLDD